MNKTDFKDLFIFIHVAMESAILNYEKTEVHFVNLLSTIFGAQRIGVVEKKVNEK